jgi:hypothetical protein
MVSWDIGGRRKRREELNGTGRGLARREDLGFGTDRPPAQELILIRSSSHLGPTGAVKSDIPIDKQLVSA